MSRIALVVGAVAAAFSAAALSQATIVGPKAAGAVGERFDGYVAYRTRLGASEVRQIEAVNVLRRAHYAELAKARGVSRREVGITAGCQLLLTVGVGEYYLLSDNVWRRRAPGEAIAIPSYCAR